MVFAPAREMTTGVHLFLFLLLKKMQSTVQYSFKI